MLKIAIVGPESSGKSELAKALADYYKTKWVPEYAREYIENLKAPYTYDDVCNIAIKQIEDEMFFDKNNSISSNCIFFDTDIIITKVWLSYCYQKIPDFVENHLNGGYIDIYLLCAPDIPWVADSVREHGHDRDFFFNWYKEEIIKLGKPYFVVKGTGNKRIRNAIKFLDEQNNFNTI